MKSVAVIPARMASTRFPGKPIAKILGRPMIEHVYRRTRCCEHIDAVFTATCDQVIADATTEIGGNFIMTSSSHTRCLDRVAEAIKEIDAEIVVIVQGDEPMIDPVALDEAVLKIQKHPEIQCLNMITPINDWNDFNSSNIVKACVDIYDYILFFSRLPIPKQLMDEFEYGIKQLGVYLISKTMLLQYSDWAETPLEKIEQVDMFRFLENGVPILSHLSHSNMISVDTPEELLLVEKQLIDDPWYRKLFGSL